MREWGGPGYNQLLRWTATAYKTDAAYINNRVIGLPYERVAFDGPSGAVKSRQVYQYDWGGNDPWGDPYISTQAPSTNYTDPGYVSGRGNLIGVVRDNCTNNTTAYDDGQAIWVQRSGYNKAGSVLWVKDAGAPRPSDGVVVPHRTSFSYSDSFSDTSKDALGTLAYPTQLTDAEGYSSTRQYNYDFGSLTATHSPSSGTTPSGVNYVDLALLYDSYGRVQKATNQTGNVYKKWVYDLSHTPIHTYETSTGTTTADEFHSCQVLDGAGQLRASASDHPGSTGGHSGQHFVYDNVGRLTQRSNPTEMNGQWTPDTWAVQGDDSAWIYTVQSYDWKGRPKQITNPDGTTRLMTYGGCGCAGGDVTTTQDEHGRRRRYTKDALGRLAKTEGWTGTAASTRPPTTRTTFWTGSRISTSRGRRAP